MNGSGSSNGNHGDTSTDALSHHLPNPNLHPFRKMQRVEFNSPPLPLNFTPVDNERIPMIPTYTCTPRQSPSRARPRLFELEEAPVFYPTKEQWADPLSYIQYVGDPEGGNGKAYGIAKIVPPDDWHPDFVLDQNVSGQFHQAGARDTKLTMMFFSAFDSVLECNDSIHSVLMQGLL